MRVLKECTEYDFSAKSVEIAESNRSFNISQLSPTAPAYTSELLLYMQTNNLSDHAMNTVTESSLRNDSSNSFINTLPISIEPHAAQLTDSLSHTAKLTTRAPIINDVSQLTAHKNSPVTTTQAKDVPSALKRSHADRPIAVKKSSKTVRRTRVTKTAPSTHTAKPTVNASSTLTARLTVNALSTHTTRPTINALSTHTTRPTVNAPSTLTARLTVNTPSTHTAKPTVNASSTHTNGLTVNALSTHTSKPTVNALSTHTAKPTVNTPSTHTAKPTVNASSTHTASATVNASSTPINELTVNVPSTLATGLTVNAPSTLTARLTVNVPSTFTTELTVNAPSTHLDRGCINALSDHTATSTASTPSTHLDELTANDPSPQPTVLTTNLSADKFDVVTTENHQTEITGHGIQMPTYPLAEVVAETAMIEAGKVSADSVPASTAELKLENLIHIQAAAKKQTSKAAKGILRKKSASSTGVTLQSPSDLGLKDGRVKKMLSVYNKLPTKNATSGKTVKRCRSKKAVSKTRLGSRRSSNKISQLNVHKQSSNASGLVTTKPSDPSANTSFYNTELMAEISGKTADIDTHRQLGTIEEPGFNVQTKMQNKSRIKKRLKTLRHK